MCFKPPRKVTGGYHIYIYAITRMYIHICMCMYIYIYICMCMYNTYK